MKPKVGPVVNLSPKGKELGLDKPVRKTSWSPKSQTTGGISLPYSSTILIPPSSHMNRKSVSPKSHLRTSNQQISPKLSPKTSR